MQGLRSKASALIKLQPRSQKPRKEKKSRKNLKERLGIWHPIRSFISHPIQNVNVPIDYPDHNGSWEFNDFLDNHNASSRNRSPRDQNFSRQDREPQGHNVQVRNASVNSHPYRLSQFPLRVTNPDPSPESSTENLPKRRCTPPETSAYNPSRNNISNLNSREPNPYVEYHQQNAGLSYEEGSNHIQWASDAPEHDNPASDAGYEAQIEHESDLRAAREVRLRDALLMVNPLFNEDVPTGGIPTRHGTGSRYHQYSRPETFARPSRASDYHYTEGGLRLAGTEPARRGLTPATPSGLQTVVEEDELALTDIQPPTRAFVPPNTNTKKRQGRIFCASELPSPLRIGYNDRTERLSHHLSLHDEEHLHISRIEKSGPVTPIQPDPDPSSAAFSHPIPRLPSPPLFHQPSDPQAGDLTHSINGSLLRRSAHQEAETPNPSPLLLLGHTYEADNPPTTPSHHPQDDEDLRLKRNSSASLLSLPGHYGDGHLPLPSNPQPPRTSPQLKRSSSVSLPSSTSSTSSTHSLRQNLIRTLGQHELKHRSPTPSSSSLYCNIITVLAQPHRKPVQRDLRRKPVPSPLPLPSRSPSPPRTNLRDVGKGIRKAARNSWRKYLFDRDGRADGEVMGDVLFDAIGPGLEERGLGRWRRELELEGGRG
ncbi:MAG: hypothetical protein HETSPECPRED_002557 [Heterodermia speciosa]|uniref:Uncharacterized protein n=1 Tax=Heterodermia speciosa TaxID=116794 RepID=A0A8H3IJ91_9LECA|nr:MAG: hypothetical protein HETSPECPRED_002557 [Heterodermia speciosa]